MYSCDDKAEFSALLLQSSVSHDLRRFLLISVMMTYVKLIG